jgi:predicted metal-dependent HD superfamily phosphohydrolase
VFKTVAQVMDGLRGRYAEPHRAYHGQSHVDAMLDGLRAIRHAFAAPEAADLAVWFHDAIYDPAAADNEARSAALMLDQLTGVADPTLLRRAATMIRATATHAIPPGLAPDLVRDTALFLDLDLAVLGADPGTYDAYERGIAAEYGPVHGEARFRTGRLAFLQAMLGRSRLFLTPEAHERLDALARTNIARAIRTLAGPFP